jgi:3-dehydroquinate synthase
MKNIDKDDIVIVDDNVYRLHKLAKLLPKTNIIKVFANEKSKSFENLGKIIKKILQFNFRKNKKVIVIGGGITQDIGSFISSIIFRGVDWIFYPTSFLAQCDSCIGGKTSINFHDHKNQLGNFNPPKKIFIDTKFLKSISKKDTTSGIGEMAHYFLVAGPKEKNFFVNNYKKALNHDLKISEQLIFSCLKIKKFFIEKDEFDRKERLLLNYGHTYGHAIETLTEYKIPHGIAVAHGMNIANFLSFKYGFLNYESFLELQFILKDIYGRFKIKNFDVNKYCLILKKDKKNINSNLRTILTRGVGKMFIHEIKMDNLFKKNVNNYFLESVQ